MGVFEFLFFVFFVFCGVGAGLGSEEGSQSDWGSPHLIGSLLLGAKAKQQQPDT